MNEPDKILFSEVQRFSVLLVMPLVILFIAAIALEGHMIFRPVFESMDAGDEIWPNWALPVSIAGILLNVVVTLVLIFAKLQTRLDSSALYIRFFPFHFKFKKFDFDSIATVYARTYQPLGEFGGWGIRRTSEGHAYNVSGNHGVQLKLKNGKNILLGSQRASELAAQLQEVMFHSRLAAYADEQNEEVNSSDSSLEQTD